MPIQEGRQAPRNVSRTLAGPGLRGTHVHACKLISWASAGRNVEFGAAAPSECAGAHRGHCQRRTHACGSRGTQSCGQCSRQDADPKRRRRRGLLFCCIGWQVCERDSAYTGPCQEVLRHLLAGLLLRRGPGAGPSFAALGAGGEADPSEAVDAAARRGRRVPRPVPRRRPHTAAGQHLRHEGHAGAQHPHRDLPRRLRPADRMGHLGALPPRRQW